MSLKTRAVVYEALPAVLPDALPFASDHRLPDVPVLTPESEQRVMDHLKSPRFDAWSEALSRVGNCACPVRLVGRSQTIDTTTGEISTYTSADEPLGVTHVRCGNRRASVCPSCSRTYAADMFHLIRAGVAGGKTVPETVAAGQAIGGLVDSCTRPTHP